MSTYAEHRAVTPDGVLVTDGKVHLTRPYTELKLKVASGGTVDGKKTFTLSTGESVDLSVKDGEPIVIQLADKETLEAQSGEKTELAVQTATVKAEHDVTHVEKLDDEHKVVEEKGTPG
jgi:hypothetical protein